MRIFLTGGSGFIGRNIIEELSGKHTIIAPTHKELDLLDEDAVQVFMRENRTDVVIHGAIKPAHRNAKDLSNVLYNNTRMYFNLVRNSGCFDKMLYLGSGLCYDTRYYEPKMDEDCFGRHIPKDDAGFAKYICSRHCLDNEQIIDLRVFGVFGKYEDYSIRFISNAICKTLFGLPVTIRQNRKFDYISVHDLIAVMDFMMQNNMREKCYNITPDRSLSLLEIAGMVQEIAGCPDRPVRIAREGMGMEYSGSNTRLMRELTEFGFEFEPLKKSIRDLFDYYKNNKDSIDKELLLFDK